MPTVRGTVGPASAFERGHQRRVAARCRGIDAGNPLSRKARDVMRPAGLRSGTAEALAAERLAFDDRSDLVAVDVEIADARMLLDIVANRVDPALQAERKAVTGGVDRLDHLVELITGEADDVKNRAEI